MTSDTATASTITPPRDIWQSLTVVAAGFTLLFALLALVFGNRLATLQNDYLNAQIAGIQSDGIAALELESALATARSELETAQQELSTEKAAIERLRRQLGAAMDELKATKANLAGANQTIAELQSSLAEQNAISPQPSESPGATPLAPSADSNVFQEPPAQPLPLDPVPTPPPDPAQTRDPEPIAAQPAAVSDADPTAIQNESPLEN